MEHLRVDSLTNLHCNVWHSDRRYQISHAPSFHCLWLFVFRPHYARSLLADPPENHAQVPSWQHVPLRSQQMIRF